MEVRKRVAPHVLEFSSADATLQDTLGNIYHAATDTDAAPTLRYRMDAEPGGLATARAPRHPPFGPADLPDAFAFLEWRATEDLLATDGSVVFLHAAGVEIGRTTVLLVGASGAGKSTIAAHLLESGSRAWGDDLVRFASDELLYSAVPRSFKIDYNSLKYLHLLESLCHGDSSGTFLAPGCWYVSPAAVRRDWEAPEGRPQAVVLLDRADHGGPPRIETMSEGEAAVRVAQALLGRDSARARGATAGVLESLAEVRAFRARGGDASMLAAGLREHFA